MDTRSSIDQYAVVLDEEQEKIAEEIFQDLNAVLDKMERLLEVSSKASTLENLLRLYEEIATAQDGANRIRPSEDFEPDDELPF